jgi:hypothetical protein
MAWAKQKAPKGDRGYGYQYQRLRKALLPCAYSTPGVRCGELMLPGQALHLDHDDWDRTKLRGFSHAECNIRAAAQKAQVMAAAKKARATQTYDKSVNTASRW